MKSKIKILFLLIAITVSSFSVNAGSDDFEKVKKRVVDELMKSVVSDSQVESVLAIMNDDGSFQGIDYDDLSRIAGFPHGRHTRDLGNLARAYRNSNSRFYRDRDLKEKITRSLQHWVDNDYIGDNWHDNQITTPTNLTNLMLLIGDELPDYLIRQAQPAIRRATMVEEPGVFYGARPGGDRIAIAGIVAKNLLFLGDREGFDDIIQIIASEIKFTTGERGMQHDYSFHHRHDRVNNTTDYGYGKYANAFGEWSWYVAGTRYQFPVESINMLVDYYLDGVYKQLVYGIYDDVGVRNRGITARRGNLTPRGTVEIERLLFSTDYRSDELKEILRLRTGEQERTTRSFAKFFWQTEHFVFQRPNFYTSVRMHSTRNRNMEEPYNGPGIVTHHRADGANYLLLKGDEYHNIWPVYDWQKVSGTTVMQKPQLHGPGDIQKEGLTEFVGAVTDGLYGAVAYDFKSPHDMVEAKKSWFFFDQEYVSMGSEINSEPDLPVYTTINQVLMRSNVTVMQDGRVRYLSPGDHDLDDVKWVYHDRVGYILPEPANVHVLNQLQRGRWSDLTLQKNISDQLIAEFVFLMGFNHGNHPSNGSYQYIVVPDVSQQDLSRSAGNNRNIDILSNASGIHAVRHNGLGICQIAAYRAGKVELSPGSAVEFLSPGMAMLKMDGNRITELTLSDPSRTLTRLMITVPGRYTAKGDNFSTMPEGGNSTRFIVSLPQGPYAGQSVTIML
jgi:chondroitin AC lyase